MIHVHVPGRERPTLWVIFAFGLVLGGFELYRGLSGGHCIDVTAAELEAGKSAPGAWLRVHGRALWDRAGQQKINRKMVYFVPVVSEGWEPGARAAVVLEYRRGPDEPAPSGEPCADAFEGTVIRGRGVARYARQQLDGHGALPAENYLLLSPGSSPRDLIERGAVGTGLAVLALMMMPLIKWLRRHESNSTEGRR